MSQPITYTQCPCCESSFIKKTLTAKDYTISKDLFEIWECADCTVRFTQHVPDISSIGYYYKSEAYVSHSDTSKGLINRLYHLVRNYTLQQKRKLVEKYAHISKGKLLDIGSGTGAFANTMQQAGWQVTGLEPDDTARQNALNKYNLQLLSPDNLYGLNDNQFDAITLWHVLEHVHDLHGYISKFKTALKDNGRLIIAVPNYTGKDTEIYGQYWAAYDVPRHLYHFSPKSIDQLAAKHGFTVEAHKPMWFDSFYVSMLSEEYKNGKSNLFAALWNGLRSNLNALQDVKKCSSVIYILKQASSPEKN